MSMKMPVVINDDINGTVTISVKIGKEMWSLATRKGTDLDLLEEQVAEKETELARVIADYLGIGSYDE